MKEAAPIELLVVVVAPGGAGNFLVKLIDNERTVIARLAGRLIR
jgi:hypothetical protein